MTEEVTQSTPETPATQSQVPTVNAAYVVILNDDGTLNTVSVKPGKPVYFDVVRASSTYDILTSSQELVSEIESQILADRVARNVVAALTPKTNAEETKEKVLDALNDRGIETPTV